MNARATDVATLLVALNAIIFLALFFVLLLPADQFHDWRLLSVSVFTISLAGVPVGVYFTAKILGSSSHTSQSPSFLRRINKLLLFLWVGWFLFFASVIASKAI